MGIPDESFRAERRERVDSDFLLIQKVKSGDEKAIQTFVENYYPMILRYCSLRIEDSGHAEDLTQETFERFFRTLDQYQHYGKAANYLYVIAGNLCRDHFRKRREIPLDELPEQTDSGMRNLEEWMDVRSALEALPEEFRETAVLFFFQGMKQKEIGQILGIGVSLVKYRIKRARELLREYLDEGGGYL